MPSPDPSRVHKRTTLLRELSSKVPQRLAREARRDQIMAAISAKEAQLGTTILELRDLHLELGQLDRIDHVETLNFHAMVLEVAA